MANLCGRIFNETYRLHSLIGEGATGAVYDASHTRHRRHFAIKVLSHELALDETMVARFKREALLTAELQNRHIVEVVDFNVTGGGEHYIVMELLQGEALSTRLIRETHLTAEQTARILTQMAYALDAVHRRGIVHRDLKPANVFLCRRAKQDDFVKLLDFGISKLLDDRSNLTLLDARLGTPYFMAPEQANPRDVDHRADIYAAGVMAFVMLTGQPPYVGDDGRGDTFIRLQRQQQREPPVALRSICPQLPEAVEAVVARALSIDPDQRHATVGDLASDFARAVEPCFSQSTQQQDEDTTLVFAGHGPKQSRGGQQEQDTVLEQVIAIDSMEEMTSDTRVESCCEMEQTLQVQQIPGASAPVVPEPPTVVGAGDPDDEQTLLLEGQKERGEESTERRTESAKQGLGSMLTEADTYLLQGAPRAEGGKTTGEQAMLGGWSSRVAAWNELEETQPPSRAQRLRMVLIVAGSALVLLLGLSLALLLIHDASHSDRGAAGAPATSAPAPPVGKPESPAQKLPVVSSEPRAARLAATPPAAPPPAAPPPEAGQSARDTTEKQPRGPEARSSAPPPRPGQRASARVAAGRGVLEVFTTSGDQSLWADIYLDGKRVGQSPLMLRRVTPGTHRVEVRRRGFRSQIKTVTLGPGQKLKLVFRLER